MANRQSYAFAVGFTSFPNNAVIGTALFGSPTKSYGDFVEIINRNGGSQVSEIIDRSSLTPMMQQYFEVKDQYNDSILMYRLGDFYEMFFDDAEIASRVLDITLTGRACGLEERAPMCGVPFHAADSYISKLVLAGYSVAVCEQMENPADTKGIVKRDVIRVITPGTLMDTTALDSTRNNYLCSVCIDKGGAAVAFADITTGDCSVCEIDLADTKTKLLNELVKYMPTEIIINLEGYEDIALVESIREKTNGFVRNYRDWAFELSSAEERLCRQFGDVEVIIPADKPYAIRALGGMLVYLEETQKTEIRNITGVDFNRDAEKMQLDMYSLRNLEIIETLRDRNSRGSLINTLKMTETAMGARLLRKSLVAPLCNTAAITNRHLAVAELVGDPILREEIREALRGVRDIERVINRIVYKNAHCPDLLGLSTSLYRLPTVLSCLNKANSKLLCGCAAKLDTLDDIRDLIDDNINPEATVSLRNGGIIKRGANEEIDRLRNLVENGQTVLKDIVEKEKEKTGIKIMKLGFNKVFGYYIEISNSYLESVPEYFIRKQTLTNGERFITPELKELEEEILTASEKLVDMEYELFCQIRDRVGDSFERVCKTASVVALVDMMCSFAAVAERNSYVMPTVNMSDKIIIKGGRHPVVERLLKNGTFISNDTVLDNKENQISIITGPNMAGKSTYMRQTALIVLMAQAGSFVPADSAEIGIVDKIFTRVGASDDLSSGQSTFMVEMTEVSYILDNATKRSLIVLDEIGRGTSTYDGLGIAWAVVEHIADVKKCGAKTMFATHYHELCELEDRMANVKNFCIAVKKHGDSINFLRKIIRGGADRSYGVEVAALAGVKKSVVQRAKEIVESLESEDKHEVKEAKISGISAQQDFGFGFIAADNVICDELKSLDLNSMTPMQALTTLYDLQAKAKNL